MKFQFGSKARCSFLNTSSHSSLCLYLHKGAYTDPQCTLLCKLQFLINLLSFFLIVKSLLFMDLSQLLFSHCYVHILLSHALSPYFHLNTIHLLFVKPQGASDPHVENSFSNSIDLTCSCLYRNIQLAYYSFVVLTCDYSGYSHNLFFTG